MRIAITGSSGFIGSALVPALEAAGHEVWHVVRRPVRPGAREISWNPARGDLDAAALRGIEAVVHLAGENLSAGRWTDERKARIRDSRVRGTQLIAETLARLEHTPRVLVCASAAGFYGDRGDEVLDESSPPGTGFLAETCIAWEAAAEPARARGIRVVHLRTALVLDPAGGALARLVPLFRWGLGAPLGSGRQWWSWITRADYVAVVRQALEQEIAGVVNTVAPEPVTCAAFTRTLARVLGRPTLPPVPGFLLRILVGEMADAALLSSARVHPARLRDAKFEFQHATLEPALAALLHSDRPHHRRAS